MATWFEEDPERYQAELLLLEEAGFDFHKNEDEHNAGRLQLVVVYPDGEESHELTASFPAEYPYFPFRIVAPTFPVGRHIHPYGFDLCLLSDLQNQWDGTRDTLAGFLQDQVPQILEVHRDEAKASNLESHEAFRPSWYLQYDPGTKVLVGDWKIPPQMNRGTMTVALDPGSDPNERLRGAATALFDEHRDQIAELDAGAWTEAYSDRKRTKQLKVRWVRLPEAPKKLGTGILDEAFSIWPELRRPVFAGGPDIVGLLFPEEKEYRGDWIETWAFVVRRKVRRQRQNQLQWSVARSDILSRDAFQARVPRVTPIADKRVLLVGLGALGAPLAWQLARAGVGALNCLDRDFVQVGNLVRWLMGFDAVGLPKAEAVPRCLQSHYPYLDARGFVVDIGSNATGNSEYMEMALDGVDLIVDATAEWAVNLYLSDLARKREMPYAWVTATPGGWGGTVGRVVPGQTKGCWHCFQRFMFDGTIPKPPQEKEKGVQPPGCFHPTFTGTGFDMDGVSLMATRLAVATLCSGYETAYPDFDWDAGVLWLWDEATGQPIAPKWETAPLERHPDCPRHD